MSELHPLEIVFRDALAQATKGKGIRHGGDTVPFYDQRWKRLAELHGQGFLTGQANKNLEESIQKNGIAFENGVLETIVYLAMAILKSRNYPSE